MEKSYMRYRLGILDVQKVRLMGLICAIKLIKFVKENAFPRDFAAICLL